MCLPNNLANSPTKLRISTSVVLFIISPSNSMLILTVPIRRSEFLRKAKGIQMIERVGKVKISIKNPELIGKDYGGPDKSSGQIKWPG